MSIVVLLVCFLWSHPHLAPEVFAIRRQWIWKSLAHDIQQNHSLDVREYWKFREFFSVGSFSFSEAYIELSGTQRIVKLPPGDVPLLRYTASHLQSEDYIVRRDPAVSYEAQRSALLGEVQKNTAGTVMFSSDTELIMQQGNSYTLAFVQSINAMRQANGLFDYLPEEQSLLQSTFWFNKTTFTL